MSYSVYKVITKAISGVPFLRYTNGDLTNIELPAGMKGDCFDGIISVIPQHEEDIVEGARIEALMMKRKFTVEIQAIKSRTIREKVIHFCAAHHRHRGIHYTPKDREKANLKSVPVTRRLLDIFFESPLQHFTIDNYISRINITRDWLANGIPSKSSFKFPDYWDPDFERKLKGTDLQDYHQHLTTKGYVKDYNPNRGTIWTEKETLNERSPD